jgi:hypothetical protein
MTTHPRRDSLDAALLAADLACTAFGEGVGELVTVATAPTSTGDVVTVAVGAVVKVT